MYLNAGLGDTRSVFDQFDPDPSYSGPRVILGEPTIVSGGAPSVSVVREVNWLAIGAALALAFVLLKG